MSDDERRHLEGLDEQTERERRDEFFAAASAVGDAAALTDDEFQSVMNGIAHLPCAEAGICQEPDPRAVIDSIISERVTTARAQAWEAGHGWCDDDIDGMCDHKPFDTSPYDHEHDWIEAGQPWDPQACGVCGAVRR